MSWLDGVEGREPGRRQRRDHHGRDHGQAEERGPPPGETPQEYAHSSPRQVRSSSGERERVDVRVGHSALTRPGMLGSWRARPHRNRMRGSS